MNSCQCLILSLRSHFRGLQDRQESQWLDPQGHRDLSDLRVHLASTTLSGVIFLALDLLDHQVKYFWKRNKSVPGPPRASWFNTQHPSMRHQGLLGKEKNAMGGHVPGFGSTWFCLLGLSVTHMYFQDV